MLTRKAVYVLIAIVVLTLVNCYAAYKTTQAVSELNDMKNTMQQHTKKIHNIEGSFKDTKETLVYLTHPQVILDRTKDWINKTGEFTKGGTP